jgi:mRNA interferase MazF
MTVARTDTSDRVVKQRARPDPTPAPLFRLNVEANERNGLNVASRLMVDKITTVPKARIGAQIGRLDDEDIVRLNRAVLVFLGFAGSTTQS